MKAYQIVRGGSIQDLEEKVEELVVEGFRPSGGVSILASCYVQAVFHPGILNALERKVAEPIITHIPHTPLVPQSSKTKGECPGFDPPVERLPDVAATDG